LAESWRLAGEIVAFPNRKRRNAGAGEREVIGAIIRALLGTRIGLDGETEALRRVLNQRPERCALRAGDDYAGRATYRLQTVVVERRNRVPGRNNRMLAVVFRSAQSAFFGRHREKQRRAARLLRQRRPR